MIDRHSRALLHRGAAWLLGSFGGEPPGGAVGKRATRLQVQR